MALDVRNAFFFTLLIVSYNIILEVKCVQGLCLWRNNSIEVNDELFKGSWRGNSAGMTNEIAAGLLSSAFFFFLFPGYPMGLKVYGVQTYHVKNPGLTVPSASI